MTEIYEKLELYFILFVIIIGVIYISIHSREIFLNEEKVYKVPEIEFQSFDEPIITISFDDGWKSQYIKGLPILNKYNFSAVSYIIPDYIERNYPAYLSKQELNELQNKYHWDIASHYFDNFDNLSDLQLENIYQKIQKWMYLNNYNARFNIAYPQGFYNRVVLNSTKKYFYTGRTVLDNRESLPINNSQYEIGSYEVARFMTYDEFTTRIDEVKAKKEWLILVFHKIEDNPIHNTEITQENFDKYMSYVNQSKIRVLTLSHIYKEKY